MERLWKGCEQNELQKQFRRGVFRRNLWGAKCAKGKGKAMQGYARLARLAFVGEMKAWRSRWGEIWGDGKHMQTACSVEGKPSKYPDMSRYVTICQHATPRLSSNVSIHYWNVRKILKSEAVSKLQAGPILQGPLVFPWFGVVVEL